MRQHVTVALSGDGGDEGLVDTIFTGGLLEFPSFNDCRRGLYR